MSASAIRRAPIPRRSSQSCARWACDGRARGDDHGRHGGDGRCRRARGRARRARRRAGHRARPRLSTSTRRGCPKRAQRGRRHARRRACAARGAPSALASAARASTSSSLASGAAARTASLRIAPYRVMMVSESASRRCDPVLGAPDAALDSGQRLSGRGAYACSACGRSGRGQLRHGSPPARRRICRWGGAAGDARAGRPERR